MTSDARLPAAIAVLGGLALALAIGWWWLVFSEVVDGAYITYGQAARCIAGTNDLCMLAEALCKSSHFLGIKRYSSELFWIGLAGVSAGLFLATTARRPA